MHKSKLTIYNIINIHTYSCSNYYTNAEETIMHKHNVWISKTWKYSGISGISYKKKIDRYTMFVLS